MTIDSFCPRRYADAVYRLVDHAQCRAHHRITGADAKGGTMMERTYRIEDYLEGRPPELCERRHRCRVYWSGYDRLRKVAVTAASMI